MTPRNDKPSKATVTKNKMNRILLRIFWKYTLGSTLSNPWKSDVKIPIKTVKGMATERIFKGVESSELWKIFVEIVSEERKRIKEKIILASKAIFNDEEITPFTFPSSFFPL